MDYQRVTDPEKIREYLGDADVVAFDFETAPGMQWRDDPAAALDAHKAGIAGISMSVKPGTAVAAAPAADSR